MANGSKRKGTPMDTGTTSAVLPQTEETPPPGIASETMSEQPSSPVGNVREATEKQRRRKPQVVMDEAVARVASGEAVEKIASELDVEPKAVRGWVRKAERSQRVSTSPVSPDSPASPLLKALASAGIEAETIPPLESDQTARAEERTEQAPPLSGPQLMLLIEAVDRMTITAICAAKAPKGVSKAAIERTIKLPAEDKAVLESLAPYAADYLPSVMHYMKPAMALLFVGTWGFSVVTRLKAVQNLAVTEAKVT